jgi:hypothetical protein
MQSRDAGLALPGVPHGECGTRGRQAVPPTAKALRHRGPAVRDRQAGASLKLPCRVKRIFVRSYPRLTNLPLQLQNGGQPVKRKRALLASNPPRNSRSEAELNASGAATGRPSSWGFRTASPCLKNAPRELVKSSSWGTSAKGGLKPHRLLPFCISEHVQFISYKVFPP